jgi:hypothetical protein
MSDFKKHREFIHAVSNDLAISDGVLRRVKKLRQKDHCLESKQEITELLNLSDKYISDCIDRLKNYRNFIYELEAEK